MGISMRPSVHWLRMSWPTVTLMTSPQPPSLSHLRRQGVRVRRVASVHPEAHPKATPLAYECEHRSQFSMQKRLCYAAVQFYAFLPTAAEDSCSFYPWHKHGF